MSAAAPAPTPRCAGCAYFVDEPAAFEAALPGLRVLSSAYASVRADDGLCGVHARFMRATHHCERHMPRTA